MSRDENFNQIDRRLWDAISRKAAAAGVTAEIWLERQLAHDECAEADSDGAEIDQVMFDRCSAISVISECRVTSDSASPSSRCRFWTMEWRPMSARLG